jgi:hypothetical protein
MSATPDSLRLPWRLKQQVYLFAISFSHGLVKREAGDASVTGCWRDRPAFGGAHRRCKEH